MILLTEDQTGVAAMGRVIQLSVAPVFLLAAVSGLLNVLINRLGRIIDRSRVIEERLKGSAETDAAQSHARLRVFSRRARCVSAAITLCTASASMVCLVVMSLFIGAFFEVDLSRAIGLLFIAAMFSLFVALVCFLQEIFIATRSLRIGPG
jgi:hypothetical protein